jgi:hypothetical protein
MTESLMSTIGLAYLSDLFQRHGVACETHGEWILPHSELPALRAVWWPRDTSGRLDIEVFIREGIFIRESFGGVGTGSAGLLDALHNFTVNSFHVLLAALWGKDDPEQVLTEEWSVAGRTYRIHIGNVGTRGSSGVTACVPDGLLPELEKAVRGLALRGDTHWFRLYFAQIDGKSTLEALKDNEEWPPGLEVLEGLPWERKQGFYSARLFVVATAA